VVASSGRVGNNRTRNSPLEPENTEKALEKTSSFDAIISFSYRAIRGVFGDFRGFDPGAEAPG
jgi:hypothetical protein